MADVEYTTKVLPLDGNLTDEVKKLETEGWDVVPGTVPVVVYQLARVKAAGPSAQGVLQIDDSKVMVIPAGKAN